MTAAQVIVPCTWRRKLRDLDADLEQFTMDAWPVPERVLATDPSNETLDVDSSRDSVTFSPSLCRTPPQHGQAVGTA